MRRPLALLTVLLAVLVLPASASAAATVGISDQQAITFDSPFFPQLKSKVARYIAPYDVMTDPEQLARMNAWIAGAQARNQRVLIHFEHSRKSTAAGNRAPSVASYTRALRAFKRAHPSVREIGVWNEANRSRVPSRGVGQPTAGKPRLLASYYRAARRVFPGSRYRIVALDILDQNSVSSALRHLRQFQSAIGSTLARRMILGFHNYSDTNRFATSRTRQVVRAFRGREIWLTETGGLVEFGSSFPYSETRAARAIGCMFTLAKSNAKIRRLYIYNYNAPSNPSDVFDAGLLGKDGQPRPGFQAVVSRRATSCRA
jgi:hypothetical protein